MRILLMAFVVCACFSFPHTLQAQYTSKQKEKDSLLMANLPKAIQDKYAYITPFYNEWARVQAKDCRWGLINEKGEEILMPHYAQVDYQKGILVSVKNNDRILYWLRQANKLVPLQYEQVQLTADSFLMVKSGGFWGIIDTKGRGICFLRYDAVAPSGEYWRVKMDSLWGLLDKNGKEVFKPKYQAVYAWKNRTFWIKEQGKYQLLDAQKQAISSRYERIGTVEATKNGIEVCANNLWGMVNSEGKEVIPPRYAELLHPMGNVVAGRLSGSVHLLGTDGNPLQDGSTYTDFRWNETARCWEIKQATGRWGLLRADGRWWLSPQADKIIVSSTASYVLAMDGSKKWAVLLPDQTPQYQYESAMVLHDEAAGVQSGGEWSILHIPSRQTARTTYRSLQSLRGNLVGVRQNELWGVADTKGKLLVQPQYQAIESVSEGILRVQLGGQQQWIDRNGRTCNCEK